MSKVYDFAKAKQIIEDHKKSLAEASLGIQEDWFWTAETVYEEGEFTQELDEIESIAGIPGSSWGTPVIKLEFEDGSQDVFTCYTGESSQSDPGFGLTSGPLSGPVQENMLNAKEYKKENS